MNSAYDMLGGQFVTVSEAIQKYAYCSSLCRFLCATKAGDALGKLSVRRLRLSLCGLWWSC